MNNLTAPFLLVAVLLVTIAPAKASLLDVTNDSLVPLGANDDLLFFISSDALSSGNGPSYPDEIEMLIGGMPLGGPVASIPGTSGVYMPGILFTGTLESQNGSVSMPLTDSDAMRLGLPGGDMLMTPGSRSGGSYSGPIDLLSAEATISSQQAAALFASGEVVIDIHNTGAPITFGYSGSPISSDFTASLFTGSQSVGGQIMKVECSNTPEPGTIGLLLIGLTIICTRLGHMQARQRRYAEIRITAPARYDA